MAEDITFESGFVFGSRSRSVLRKFWKCLSSSYVKYTAISRFCSSLGSQSRRKVTNRCIFSKSMAPALVSHLSWTMSSSLESWSRKLSPHVELRLRSHPCPELWPDEWFHSLSFQKPQVSTRLLTKFFLQLLRSRLSTDWLVRLER